MKDEFEFATAVRRDAPGGSGILELAFAVEGRCLQALYGGVDAVLANSGFEPFGLVGLETMAARSIVIAGATGEDYLVPFHNGFSLDTDDPREIVRSLDWLDAELGREARLREAAFETAGRYRWAAVAERLITVLHLDDGG